MNAVIASRQGCGGCTAQMLKSLPMVEMDVVGMDECRETPSCATRLPAARSWARSRAGGFVREIARLIDRQGAELVVLPQNDSPSGSLARLVADGMGILSRGRKSVLLMPSQCLIPESNRVVVGMISNDSRKSADAGSLRQVLDLNKAEPVVVAVASPFYPPFSRVANTMRGCQSQAIREVWEEQAGEATAQAAAVAEQLAQDSSKPLYIGRTGQFVSEITQVVRSDSTSLLCLLPQSSTRKWLSRSTLLDVLESVNVPVMLSAPVER